MYFCLIFSPEIVPVICERQQRVSSQQLRIGKMEVGSAQSFEVATDGDRRQQQAPRVHRYFVKKVPRLRGGDEL